MLRLSSRWQKGVLLMRSGLLLLFLLLLPIAARATTVAPDSRSADGCFYANPVSQDGIQTAHTPHGKTVTLQCNRSWCLWRTCQASVALIFSASTPEGLAASQAISAPVANRFAIWKSLQLPRAMPTALSRTEAFTPFVTATIRDRLRASSSLYLTGAPLRPASGQIRLAGDSAPRPLGSANWSLHGDVEARGLKINTALSSRPAPAPLVVRRLSLEVEQPNRWSLQGGRSWFTAVRGVIDGLQAAWKPLKTLTLRAAGGLRPEPWDLIPSTTAADAGYQLVWETTPVGRWYHRFQAGIRQGWWHSYRAPLAVDLAAATGGPLGDSWLDLDGTATMRAGLWRNGQHNRWQPEEFSLSANWYRGAANLFVDFYWWREIVSSVDLYRQGSDPLLIPDPGNQVGDLLYTLSAGGQIRLSRHWQIGMRTQGNRTSYDDKSLFGLGWLTRYGLVHTSDRISLRLRGRWGDPLTTLEPGITTRWMLADSLFLEPAAWVGWRARSYLQNGYSTWQRLHLGVDWSALTNLSLRCEGEVITGTWAPTSGSLLLFANWKIL